MKSIWLLPDFDQSGEIRALDDSGAVSVASHPDIPLRQLPAFFVLGIPESVLRTNSNENFIYAQYAKLNSNKNIFSCSIRAGRDRSERTVVLTNIQLLNDREEVHLPPQVIHGVDDEVTRAMQAMVTALEDANASANVRKMLNAVNTRRSLTDFASEDLGSSANKPQWMPKKTRGFLFFGALLVAIAAFLKSLSRT